MKQTAFLFIFLFISFSVFSQSSGCISGDCANGFGVYTWSSGEKYEGYWKSNKRNGYGTNYFSNGAKYAGNWVDDKKDGWGTYWYHPTSQYESYTGEYKMDKMTGSGFFKYRSGQKYHGEFKDNYFHGWGTMTYTNGSKETGRWEFDKLISTGSESGCISGDCNNGYGTYTFSSGEKYVGNWRNGYRTGQGTNYFATGSMYTGNWREDKKDGYGTYVYKPESQYESYTGQYVMDKMTGSGTFIHRDGKKYVGDMKDNYFHGQGIMYYPDGRVESGRWEYDKLVSTSNTYVNNNNNNTNTGSDPGCVYGDCSNGYGKYEWSNGDYYIGNFMSSKPQGKGSFYYKSGSKYIGEFKNGKRHGTGTYTWYYGKKHTGQWMDDKQSGQGTLYLADGTIKSGVWKDGEYQGKIDEATGCIFGDCNDGFGTYVWPSGEKYSGNWVSGRRKGQGTNYFSTGERYEGEWLDDLRHGYGTNYYVSGEVKAGMWEYDRYIGSSNNNYGCISGDCSNGYGVYTWESGERYEGYWQFDNTDNIGKRNGEGTNFFANGAKYTGSWKDDKKNGYGTYWYHPESQYDSYTGDFIMDKMTGSGTFKYRSGQKYVGEFLDNYFHGSGTMYYTDGRTESGKWEYDKFVESEESQSGCITGNCTSGFGTYITEGGDKYVGTFVNGLYSGNGTYTFSSGDVYEGEFSDGTYNGEGTYKFISGEKYVGEFKNGTYHGIGTIFYTDGRTKAGKWENGTYIGSTDNVVKTKATVTWLSPEYYTSTSSSKTIKAKLCIKSESDLQNVQIYVNNQLKVNNATRGYKVVNANCDYTIERDIPLDQGENEIKVVVTNAGGESSSDLRVVDMKSDEVISDQKRLALVIGNADYSISPLKNPANDAVDIAAELRALGFEVIEGVNLSQKDMKIKIREFGDKLASQKGVGLFYYAGHGLELNGENYLIPVNAVIAKEQDVELESVNLKRVMGEMDYAQNDLNIVILDACRNNPFKRSFRSGGDNGYASTEAPKGTFIAFGTAPGSVASDGAGENGLYTQELIKALRKPGLKIEDVFKEVRRNVYNLSGEQQLTWQNSSIFGDFYFKQ